MTKIGPDEVSFLQERMSHGWRVEFWDHPHGEDQVFGNTLRLSGPGEKDLEVHADAAGFHVETVVSGGFLPQDVGPDYVDEEIFGVWPRAVEALVVRMAAFRYERDLSIRQTQELIRDLNA